MTLTQAQKDTLAADILALPQGTIASGDTAGAADYYNTLFAPDYMVWNPTVATKDLMDAITWANMTPSDAADGTALWTNRALTCQGKQFNVQTILVGRDIIDATKANVRAGLQDALTNLPSGVSGAILGGGWANVKISMTRKTSRVEKLFATGSGTAVSPSLMAFVGRVSPNDFNGIV